MELDINTPKWMADFLQPSQYKAAYGGRVSGKSHAFGELLIERHMLDTDLCSVCIREVQKSLNHSVKRLLENKIHNLGLSNYFEIQDKIIKRKNGKGVIIFQGMQNHTSDSIKSLENFKIAWVEEAQSLSQYSLDMLRPTIMRNDGAELWATWNPHFESDAIDRFFRDSSPPPNSIIKKVNYIDNPWFPEVMIEELEYDRKRDPDKYAWVWLGEYAKKSDERVFKNWKIEEFETPKDALFRFGADWGFCKAATTLVRCFTIGKKLYIDYEAYRVGCEISDTPSLFLTIPESEKWPIVADSSRADTIRYMQNNGFPKMVPSIKGPGSVQDGISFLQDYDIIVHPRCKNMADELTCFSFKVDKKTNLILPQIKDEKNDLIDALNYAMEGDRRFAKQQNVDYSKIIPTSRW